VTAGGFTIWQKWWQSIKENLILYAVMAVVGVISLIVLGITQNFDKSVVPSPPPFYHHLFEPLPRARRKREKNKQN